MTNLIPTAIAAADKAGAVIRGYFRADLQMDGKDAPSPVVTVADREAELAMREVITSAFPDHQIIGEEFGQSGEGPVTWVLDPIDGTIAFVFGKPIFCSLIAAWDERGAPLLGLIDQPITGERWLASDNQTTLNDKKVQVSGVERLEDARLSTTNPDYFTEPDQRAWFNSISKDVRLTSLGGDGYAYGLMASGTIDLIIESELAWHDAAALVPIVEGAGGVVMDFDKQPIKPGLGSYNIVAASSQALAFSALERLQMVEPAG